MWNWLKTIARGPRAAPFAAGLLAGLFIHMGFVLLHDLRFPRREFPFSRQANSVPAMATTQDHVPTPPSAQQPMQQPDQPAQKPNRAEQPSAPVWASVEDPMEPGFSPEAYLGRIRSTVTRLEHMSAVNSGWLAQYQMSLQNSLAIHFRLKKANNERGAKIVARAIEELLAVGRRHASEQIESSPVIVTLETNARDEIR
jgi:hypothetical protein